MFNLCICIFIKKYCLCLLCSDSHKGYCVLFSDEDDFYDRTKKKKPSTQKGTESQTVETVDSLLEKRDKVLKEIEEKNVQLSAEKNKMETETVPEVASGDSLDAYMTGLSSTLGNSTVLFYPSIQVYFVDDLKKFSFYSCQCKTKLLRSSKSCLLSSQN